MPAHCKIAATILFVVPVVLTPRDAFWAFGFYAVMILAIARLGRVPMTTLVRRLTVEIPFVLFALFLPFIAGGERFELGPIWVSEEGVIAAWNIVAKATIGAAAGILLASSTAPAEFVHGLGRLRMPKVLVAIAGFMVRYADVVTGEMRRMRIARESRGYEPRRLGTTRVVASLAGTLFIRSFERGERVYLAMLSRGYTGSMPLAEVAPASVAQWGVALLVPAIALLVAASSWAYA